MLKLCRRSISSGKAELIDQRLLPKSRLILPKETIPEELSQNYRAAGVVPYCIVDSQPFILLASCWHKKEKTKQWTFLGGKREFQIDESAQATAVREFVEETGGSKFATDAFSFASRLSDPQLRGPVIWNHSGLYLTFFLPIQFTLLSVDWTPRLTASDLLPKNPHHEVSQFAWTPFPALIQSLTSNSQCSFLEPISHNLISLSPLSFILRRSLSINNVIPFLSTFLQFPR